jgi:hypothetical protein
VSDSFPFKWINKKWKEGFHVTSMATSHTRWAVVMSRNAGFIDQCVELDFQYPSEGIHRRWDGGFRITSCASTPDQVSDLPVTRTLSTLNCVGCISLVTSCKFCLCLLLRCVVMDACVHLYGAFPEEF